MTGSNLYIVISNFVILFRVRDRLTELKWVMGEVTEVWTRDSVTWL